LMEQPNSAAVLELFEERLTAQMNDAGYMDVDALIELGEFLAYHSLDHYAAQLLRRATELNPRNLQAWGDLARVSSVEEERAQAMAQFLGLDRGMSVAEASPSPRRDVPVEMPLFGTGFGGMAAAKA
jgi:hypothetical protein